MASLSTYARQFLERLDKPDVDVIEGLSPAIAIEQRTASHNPRSTVGTVTEIYDYLRLLYARIGVPHCHGCGQPITAQTVDGIIDAILALGDRRRLIILAPLVQGAKGTHEGLIKRLRRDGFARVRVDGKIREVEKVGKLAKTRPHTISVVVDRLVLKDGIRNRLADSLELALSMGNGMVEVLPADDDGPAEPIRFSETPVCADCGISFPEMTPAAFSFNSPQGACPHCDGLGTISAFNPDRIVPDPSLSLREGAVIPWANRRSVHFAEFLETLTARYGGDVYTPFRDLPEALRRVILYGSGDESIPFEFERKGRRYTDARPFEGVIPRMERQWRESEPASVRAELGAYMSVWPCPLCGGARLNPAARSVRVGGRTMAEVTALSVTAARGFARDLPGALSGQMATVAERIVREIGERLGFLDEVGLGYLTLDRAAHTLSGGKASGFAWPLRSEPGSPGSSTSSTSRASGSTSGTTGGSFRPSPGCGISETRSAWWSTTRRPSGPPTIWWTWGPEPGSTAGKWSIQGRPRALLTPRNPSPASISPAGGPSRSRPPGGPAVGGSWSSGERRPTTSRKSMSPFPWAALSG